MFVVCHSCMFALEGLESADRGRGWGGLGGGGEDESGKRL